MGNVIMILTNGFDPDVRVYKEAKYLVEKGLHVTILCWDRDISRNYKEFEKIDGIDLVRFKIPSVYGTGAKQIFSYMKFLIKCKKYIKKSQCDYIHCNDLDGAIVGYFCKKKHHKMVFDMHEFYEKGRDLKRSIIRKVVIFLLQKSEAGLYENGVYLGDAYKSVHSKLYPLRNYPDSTLLEPLPKTKSDTFRVAYHGVVRGQVKEFTALFEAVKELEGVEVDINGGGMDLPELTQIKNNYKNVHVNGPYNGLKDSSVLYSKTDLLFCAYDANDPNYQGDAEVIKFYEAIFTGTPILITRGIGMERKVLDNKFGVSCDTRNPEEIRNAIKRMQEDKEYWKTCHENELKNAYQYSWEEAVKILDGIYV